MIRTTQLSRFLQSAASAGCCALVLAALPPAATAAPLEAYGRLPSVDKIALSPDGSRFAVIAEGPAGRQLQVRNTADLKLRLVADAGTTKLIGLDWAAPDQVLIVAAKTVTFAELSGPKHEWWTAAVLDIADGKMRPMLTQDYERTKVESMNTLVGWPQPTVYKSKPALFLPGITFINNEGVVTVFRQGLESHSTPQIVATGNSNTDDLLVNDAGRDVARADYDQKSGQWSLWTRQDRGWQLAHKGIYKIDRPSLVAFGRDSTTVIVRTQENDSQRYREVSLEKAVWSEPIDALDNAGLIADRRKGTIIGGYVALDNGYRYIFFDPADQQLWEKIVRAFPGEVVRLTSWSDDRSKIILQVEGQKSGAAYFLLDRSTKRAEWIADEYAAVPPEDVAEVRAISYRAADGLEIPAYLTLPKGAAAKRLPLVALVHGGPESRDYPGFDWWPQALASMGYAVLQPQFRGSGGYAVSFTEAGYGQFGRKMQTDVSDGVRHLADQGIIDPSRVCIVGASYGGYAAMAGVTLQSGIYRCAVAVAGISDIRRDLAYDAQRTGGTQNSTRRYWLRFLGAKNAADQIVEDLSPARHADRLAVPLLLIHGSIDTVVEPVQSKLMLQAAQKAGKNVQLVTLKGEDHNLSRSETRLEMLQAMATFLRANLPVAAPPATTASATPSTR